MFVGVCTSRNSLQMEISQDVAIPSKASPTTAPPRMLETWKTVSYLEYLHAPVPPSGRAVSASRNEHRSGFSQGILGNAGQQCSQRDGVGLDQHDNERNDERRTAM